MLADADVLDEVDPTRTNPLLRGLVGWRPDRCHSVFAIVSTRRARANHERKTVLHDDVVLVSIIMKADVTLKLDTGLLREA